MTGRGAVLLLLSLPIVAAGAALPTLLPIGLVLLAILVMVVAVDGRRAPGFARLRVRRHHDQILSVGATNLVTVAVEASGSAVALVRDECPAELAPSMTTTPVVLPVDLTYTVTPEVRGEVHFGRTVVRAEGPWRLGFRQTAFDTAETVPVDADLSSIRTFEALARRGLLTQMGLRTTRHRGEGTDFERVRDALADDPLRRVNWPATARTGRLMVTELVPERAQPVVVCIDHGRLMGVGAGPATKLDSAINAAVLFAHVALQGGDRVGLLSFADTVTATVSPKSGRPQLRRMLDALRPLRAGETEADYDEALPYVERWQRRRALIVVFTDLTDPDQAGALVRQCGRLARRHLVMVVTVRDPAIDGAARRVPVDARTTFERAIAGGLIADREATLRILRGSRVLTVDADVRSLSPQLINRYLELKQSGRL